MSVVSVRNLRKTYRAERGRRVEALRGLSLEVREGEVFGLLGQNGAGKSTLLRCLLSLVRPTSGEAYLFGQPASRVEVRRRIGYLPEDHRFPDYHSAEGALYFYAALYGMSRAEARARVPEVLRLLGVSEWARARVRTFSKGMRQRLAFAHAILHRPKLLFLDEPTDGIDPVGRKELRDLVVALQAAGTTVFLNSHVLSEVESVCTRVLILHQGTALREGTIEELTRGSREYELSLSCEPDRAMVLLGGKFRGLARSGGGLILTVDRPEDVDRAVDLLRAEGIGLRALVPRRRTLEEIFLEVVGEAKR